MVYVSNMKQIKNYEGTVRKNLDLSEDCVTTIAFAAILKGKVFKHFAEEILEEWAKKHKPKK
jgi:hypothetical protein